MDPEDQVAEDKSKEMIHANQSDGGLQILIRLMQRPRFQGKKMKLFTE